MSDSVVIIYVSWNNWAANSIVVGSHGDLRLNLTS